MLSRFARGVASRARYYAARLRDAWPRSEEGRVRAFHRRYAGGPLHLHPPRTFNEKIQWLKINYHDPLMSQCADKYRARDYIAATVGEQHLIPLYAVWDRADEIDASAITGPAVLKANNSTGRNVFWLDPREADEADAIAKFREWMRPGLEHWRVGREWAYKDIVPRIVAEQLLVDPDGDLLEFKMAAFNGRVEYIQVSRQPLDGPTTAKYYDRDWTPVPMQRKAAPGAPVERPANLDELIRVAEALAAPFPFVRVDLYSPRGIIRVGELTFYPGNGVLPFHPEEWDRRWGDLITLPRRRR